MQFVQVFLQAVLCRLHQRTMEGSAHHQHDCPLGAALFRQLRCAFHRLLVAGDHDLVGRIDVGRRDDFALGGIGANLLQLVECHAQDRRHAAFACRYCFLHVAAAIAHRAHRVSKRYGSRGNVG